MEIHPSPPLPQPRLAECATLALVLAVIPWVGRVFGATDPALIAVDPVVGVAVGWVLARGVRAWRGVLVGAVIAGSSSRFLDGPSIATTGDWADVLVHGVAVGCAALATALTAHWTAQRLIRWPNALLKLREIGLLLGVVFPLAALVGVGVLWPFFSWMPDELGRELTVRLGAAFIGSLTGCIAFAPLLLVLVGRPRELWARSQATAVVLAVVYLFISWASTAIARSHRTQSRLEFQSQFAALRTEMEGRLAQRIGFATAISGLYAASIEVERDEFASFVGALLLQSPELQGASWEPRVMAAQRSAFETAARAQPGGSAFQIYQRTNLGKPIPVTEREDYYPITFMHPLEGNQAAIGFDLGSEPTRRAAIEQARSTGKTVCTSPIRLVQDQDSLGLLLIVPLHSTQTQEHIGCASIVINANRIFASVEDECARSGIHLTLSDTTTPDAQSLLLATRGGAPILSGASARLHAEAEFEFAGRQWRLDARPTLAHSSMHQSWTAIASASAPLALIVLIATIHLFSSGNAQRVGLLVRSENEALRAQADRLRRLVDAAPVALLALGPTGKIVLANPEATKLFGQRLDQLLGQTLDILTKRDAPTDAPAKTSATTMSLQQAVASHAHDPGFHALVECVTGSGLPLRVHVRHSLAAAVAGEFDLRILAFVEDAAHGARGLHT